MHRGKKFRGQLRLFYPYNRSDAENQQENSINGSPNFQVENNCSIKIQLP